MVKRKQSLTLLTQEAGAGAVPEAMYRGRIGYQEEDLRRSHRQYSTQAAHRERRRDWEAAARLWQKAGECAVSVAQRHWCECREARCLRQRLP